MALRRNFKTLIKDQFSKTGSLTLKVLIFLYSFGTAGSVLALAPMHVDQSSLQVSNETELSEMEWEKLTRGVDFGEREDIEEEEEESEPPEQEAESNPEEEIEESSWDYDIDTNLVGSVILGLVIVILVVILIYLIARHIKERDVKVEAQLQDSISFEKIEENLPESDLDRYLRFALESGDLRGAIRVYYLMIIQGLSENQLIKWQREKTNYEYLREMRSTPLFKAFSGVTLTYELVWYGDAYLDSAAYEALHPQFTEFLKKIENGN